jgi:uncharacterized protein (DUF342 family)
MNRAGPQTGMGDVSGLVKDLMRRVRVIEERYSSIRKNIQVGEQNMLTMNRNIMTEIKTINMDISEVKETLRQVKEDMSMIIKELKDTVNKEEVKVLQKYIQLWEPLNFVSQAEMEKYVDSRLKKR